MGERGFYTRRPPVALAPASAVAFSGVKRSQEAKRTPEAPLQ